MECIEHLNHNSESLGQELAELKVKNTQECTVLIDEVMLLREENNTIHTLRNDNRETREALASLEEEYDNLLNEFSGTNKKTK